MTRGSARRVRTDTSAISVNVSQIRQFPDGVKYSENGQDWIHDPGRKPGLDEYLGLHARSSSGELRAGFPEFLKENAPKILKAEYLIPEVVGSLVRGGESPGQGPSHRGEMVRRDLSRRPADRPGRDPGPRRPGPLSRKPLGKVKKPGRLDGNRPFWDWTGVYFPDLAKARSTRYYRESEERLFAACFGNIEGKKLLKTDLWDEAKNTRILRFAADRGADVYGIDISVEMIRLAAPCPGRRAGRAPARRFRRPGHRFRRRRVRSHL